MQWSVKSFATGVPRMLMRTITGRLSVVGRLDLPQMDRAKMTFIIARIAGVG